jgi:hypothetical protein
MVRAVLMRAFSREKEQILRPVVGLYAIDVMDGLSGPQRATQHVRHHESMF